MRDVDKVKDSLDIIEIIGDYVELKKVGRNFKANCPFHSEKTPSFHVSADRQIWHCFGACDEGGDVISFYMKAENTTFPEALNELAKRANITLTNSFEHDKSWQEKSRLYEINHLASEYYHYLLTNHSIGKVAQEYLSQRNISDKIVKTFILGYAPSGWRNLLLYLQKKGYLPEEIEKTGLIIRGKSGWYDRFRGRIIFTLSDHRGNIVGFSGRLLSKDAKEAKYINSPETILYHKSNMLYGLDKTQQSIKEKGTVILCEGEFDVLSSFQAGISNIVAIKGTALTQGQLKILHRFSDTIILALDMDVAGDKAAHRIIELAEELDFNIKVLTIPYGKDLDDAIQYDVTAVKKSLKTAPSVYDFLLSSAVKKHPTNSATAKKNIASEVIPLYSRIQNPIVKNFFVKKLADVLDISEAAINEQMLLEQKKKTLHTMNINVQENKNSQKPLQVRLEEYLLSLLLQTEQINDYLQILHETITIEELDTPAIRRIVLLLLSKKPIPEELTETYNKAYLLDIQEILSDKNVFQKEFTDTVVNIKKGILKRKLKQLATKLYDDSSHVLNDEFLRISNELKDLTKK